LRLIRPLLTILVLALSGCGGGPVVRQTGPVRIWAAPESVVVFPRTPIERENEVYSEADGIIRLAGAVNESVAFQLIFTAERSPGTVQSITLTDLRQGDASIPADHVRLYREVRVPVSNYPTWYLRLAADLRVSKQFPDPLVPLTAPRGALPIRVQPDRCEAVWAEIAIPPGTDQGIYRGQVRIASGSGRAPEELDVVLTVWPFALPQARHLSVVAGIETVRVLKYHLEVNGRPYAPTRLSLDDPAYQRATAILDETVRLLHEHRCSPVLTDVRPIPRNVADGSLEFDWSDYDRLVGSMLDGTSFENRLPVSFWPMPIDDRHPRPESYGGWGSAQYERAVRDYLRLCIEHFEERGWLDQHYVWLTGPSQDRARRYAEFERIGRLTQAVDKRLNLVCSLTPASMEPFGWIDDPFVDVSALTRIWCPPASLADPDELARQQAAGKRCWLWPDRSPFAGSLSLIAPPSDVRSLPWHAYRYGYEAIYLPTVNAWSGSGKPSDRGSEQALIWPGKPYGLDRPIPSLRLKRLRRGLQDYELLWLLEHNHRPAIAALIAEDLCPYGGTYCYGEHLLDGRPLGWVSDPSAWSLARKLMARELAVALKESDRDANDDVARFEQQMEWSRLTDVVREMRVEIEGASVRFEPADTAAPVRMDVVMSIFNATRDVFTGMLQAGDLPANWQMEGAVGVSGLAPARMTRRTLKLKAPMIEPDENGIVPIAVQLAGQDGSTYSSHGRICALTSQHLSRPIAIDGKLEDWPLGTRNVAGDFILLGATDVPKKQRFSPDRPSQRTTAFICDDRDYLYIAFNCEDNRLADRVLTRHNFVQYDELWPAGEDLVEVVLDPTGQAIDASQLLHIVVKANGAVIAEYGAPCLYPVSPCRRAAVSVNAAIDDKSQPDRWTVEIRIPLEALGERNTVWRVNFARFCPRLGEYSSWSGARRFLYSPYSLGNMRLEAVR